MTIAMTAGSSTSTVLSVGETVAPGRSRRRWRSSLTSKLAAVCVVAGATVAFGPASAAVATTIPAPGCTFVANTPVYEYNGRDDRSIVLDGHWSCSSAKTIELTSAAVSGTSIMGLRSFTWRNAKSGTWSWSQDCQVNLPPYPNVRFYVRQQVATHTGPTILGGTSSTTAYCAEFV